MLELRSQGGARAPVPLNSGLNSAAVYSSLAWTGLHGCTPRHSPSLAVLKPGSATRQELQSCARDWPDCYACSFHGERRLWLFLLESLVWATDADVTAISAAYTPSRSSYIVVDEINEHILRRHY